MAARCKRVEYLAEFLSGSYCCTSGKGKKKGNSRLKEISKSLPPFILQDVSSHRKKGGDSRGGTGKEREYMRKHR